LAVIWSSGPGLGVELDATVRSKWPTYARADARLVLAHGNYLFVATTAGLQVMSRDSIHPWTLGGCDLAGEPRDLAAQGNYAYLAAGKAGLHVIDVSDPNKPQRVGGYPTEGDVRGVVVANDYAFVAAGANGLQVINVSSPASPTRVGGYDTSGEANRVVVSGSSAYVADGSSGLQIIDITTATAPRWVGGYDTSGSASDVAVSSNFAYVADGASGLEIVDISDPASPKWKSGVVIWPSVESVVVHSGYAYVKGSDLSIKIIDVRDPTNPGQAPTWEGSGFHDVAMASSVAFFAQASGVAVYDVSRPWSPLGVGAGSTRPLTFAVALSGGYAYTAEGYNGLQIIDVRRPSQPRPVGSAHDIGVANHVRVSGNYAYVTCYLWQGYDNSGRGQAGLQIVDVRDPTKPRRVGGCAVMSDAGTTGVEVSGTYAYVACGGQFAPQSLAVVDVSNPASPKWVASLLGGISANGLAVLGNRAYLAFGGFSGKAVLESVEITDPLHPTVIGRCELGGYPYRVAVSGNHAFVSDIHEGLHIVAISNPAEMRRVSGYDPGRVALRAGLAVSGERVYLGESGNLFEVLDVGDPRNPRRVDRFVVRGDFLGVVVSGPRAFLAGGFAGLPILDLRHPVTDGFPLSVIDGKGQSLRIQRSPDLVTWEDWQRLTPESDFVELTDRDAAFAPRRFYRAVAP
jgi:hypothetical protein